MLKIRLTRLSNTQHRFEYVRDDGKGEAAELERRSLLFHDLLHFALESEAGLEASFYGLLERGATFARLRAEGFTGEIAATEQVVGMLTTVGKGNADAARATAALAASGSPLPEWLTPELVIPVQKRMRRLLCEWSALPFRQTMELRFNDR